MRSHRLGLSHHRILFRQILNQTVTTISHGPWTILACLDGNDPRLRFETQSSFGTNLFGYWNVSDSRAPGVLAFTIHNAMLVSKTIRGKTVMRRVSRPDVWNQTSAASNLVTTEIQSDPIRSVHEAHDAHSSVNSIMHFISHGAWSLLCLHFVIGASLPQNNSVSPSWNVTGASQFHFPSYKKKPVQIPAPDPKDNITPKLNRTDEIFVSSDFLNGTSSDSTAPTAHQSHAKWKRVLHRETHWRFGSKYPMPQGGPTVTVPDYDGYLSLVDPSAYCPILHSST